MGLLCLIVALIFSLGAHAADHDQSMEPHNWISQYKNGHGQGCCHATDIHPISLQKAYAAKLGSKVKIKVHQSGDSGNYVADLNVIITAIHPSHDPHGRAWITRYGCLFIPAGS